MTSFIKQYNKTFLYIVLSIMCVSFVYDMTLYGQMYPNLAHYVRRLLKNLRFILVIYFICSIDFNKNFIKPILLLFCFTAFCFVSNYYIRNWTIFDIFFVPLFLSSLIDRRTLINTIFAVVGFSFLSVLLLHFLNLLPDSVFFRHPDKIRHALGFLHPNLLGFVLLFICIMLVLKKRGLDKSGFAFLLASSCFCYFVPNSNSSCLLIIILIALSALSNYLKKKNLTSVQLRKVFFLSCVFVFSVITLSYVIVYTEWFSAYISSLPGELWARFSMAKTALARYDITLFGNRIEVSRSFTVDFAYLFIPISYGITGFCLFIIFFINSIKKAIFRHCYELLAVFLLMTVYGISETVIFTPLFMFVYLSAYANDSEQDLVSK